MISGCGVVYIATQQDRYLEEAFLSAETLKHWAPSLPVTLFTDLPETPLCRAHCFDAVTPLAGADIGHARANAMINRFIGLTRTPYERTLYLDTDARVGSAAINRLFDLLDAADVAMVEDVPSTSVAVTKTGRRLFNCGVILYRRSGAELWLEPWEAAARRNLTLAQQTPVPPVPGLPNVEDAATRRWLLEVDKIALHDVLRPEGPSGPARVAVLDGAWNDRRPHADTTTHIHHPRDRIGTTTSEIGAIAERWRAGGRTAEADALFAYLDDVT